MMPICANCSCSRGWKTLRQWRCFFVDRDTEDHHNRGDDPNTRRGRSQCRDTTGFPRHQFRLRCGRSAYVLNQACRKQTRPSAAHSTFGSGRRSAPGRPLNGRWLPLNAPKVAPFYRAPKISRGTGVFSAGEPSRRSTSPDSPPRSSVLLADRLAIVWGFAKGNWVVRTAEEQFVEAVHSHRLPRFH
jgi:hypothetical protein